MANQESGPDDFIQRLSDATLFLSSITGAIKYLTESYIYQVTHEIGSESEKTDFKLDFINFIDFMEESEEGQNLRKSFEDLCKSAGFKKATFSLAEKTFEVEM